MVRTVRRHTAGRWSAAFALAAIAVFVSSPATTLLLAQELNWVMKSPAVSPTPRIHHAMTYDKVRAQVVLFGGDDGHAYLNDTWVWDGLTWTHRTPLNSPTPRSLHGTMVYDAARGQVVLFGGWVGNGNLNDTWVWDGTNWTQKTPAASPTPRVYSSMTYDEARREVVLFGGWDDSNYLNDTWVWDGANWTQKSVVTSPTPRAHHSMTYDDARGQVVLFGGGDGNGFYNDTWIWDGTNWTQQSPATSPPPRPTALMEYDVFHAQVIVFGGGDAPPAGPREIRNDMWMWEGTNWTQSRLATNPTPRAYSSIAYDLAHGQLVLFGGMECCWSTVGDTWVWPGNSIAPATMVVDVVPLGAAAATFSISPPVSGMPSSGPYPVTVNGVPPATYTVTFNPVLGFVTPLPQTVMPNSFGRIEAIGVYSPTTVSGPAQVVLTVGKNGSGGGSVTSGPIGINCGSSCTAALEAGTHVKLEAVADRGSTFVGWSDSFCKGTLRPCSFTLPGDRTIKATFVPTPQDSGNKIIYVGVCGAGEWFDDTCLPGYGSYDPRDVFTWGVDPLDDAALDSVGHDYSGLDAIGLRIARLFPTSVTVVTGFSIANVVSSTVGLDLIKNNVASIVDFIVGVYHPGDRIFLVGHSAGGPIVRDVAKSLLKRKIPVAMTAWIDSVSVDGTVPRNVMRAFNFFYPAPLIPFCGVSGNFVIVPEKKSGTIVSNSRIDAPSGPVDLGFPCGGHRNMDNDPLVWRPILDFMVGIP